MRKLFIIVISLFCISSTYVFAQGLGTDNTWTNNNRFAGADPWFDITAYGGRAVSVSSPPSNSTASCTNGSATVTTSTATSGFQNGDGVVVYGCGGNGPATPGAPTVTPGISDTETVPDAVLSSATGSTTYNYLLVARDQSGGLSIPSSITSIANGPSTLGMISLTVTSESLSGNTLTIILSTTSPLTAGEFIHVKNSSNATLSGWFLISSVAGSGQTLTINNTPIYTPSATLITSTGGTLTYAAGNQLTWAQSASVWEYVVCAERPGDSSYHIIGLSFPYNSAYSSTAMFTDWGPTLTTKPTLPAYMVDSGAGNICAAISTTNDYLSTTIVSGAGTMSLGLAATASNTTPAMTTTTILFDDGPAILAAATAASANHGVVFIPEANSGSYVVNSFTNLFQYRVTASLRQEGALTLNETLEPPYLWYGFTAPNTSNPFSQATTPVVECTGAWPCVYLPGGVPDWNWLTLNNSGNQSLLMLWDQGTDGGLLKNINLSTGTTTPDYTGIGLVVRPGAYNFSLDTINFNSGPGVSGTYIDSTWTPELYFARSPNSPYSVIDWTMRNLSFSSRTAYQMAYGGTDQQDVLDHDYTQGGILPLLTVQTVVERLGLNLKVNNFVNDTSPEAYIALEGPLTASITAQDMNVPFSETASSGPPPDITGAAPNSFISINDYNLNENGSGAIPLSNYINSSRFELTPY